MQLFFKVFFILGVFCSCTYHKNDVRINDFINCIGKDGAYARNILESKGWHLSSEGNTNKDYNYSYLYANDKSLFEYISVDKCNKNNTICHIISSINKEDFLNKIPADLKALNYVSIDDKTHIDTLHFTYAQPPLYRVAVTLNKWWRDSICKYSVQVRFVSQKDVNEQLNK